MRTRDEPARGLLFVSADQAFRHWRSRCMRLRATEAAFVVRELSLARWLLMAFFHPFVLLLLHLLQPGLLCGSQYTADLVME